MSRKDVSRSKSLSACQREWLSHLEAWREQGGTLKAYALRHDLSVSGLYTARGLLERRGAWKSRGKTGTARATTPPKLVPVRLTAARTPAPARFRVVLPSGVVVEIPEHADPARGRAWLVCVAEVFR